MRKITPVMKIVGFALIAAPFIYGFLVRNFVPAQPLIMHLHVGVMRPALPPPRWTQFLGYDVMTLGALVLAIALIIEWRRGLRRRR